MPRRKKQKRSPKGSKNYVYEEIPGKKYRVRARVNQTRPDGTVKEFVERIVYGTKQDARFAQLQLAVSQGVAKSEETRLMTVGQAIDMWLIARPLKPRTRRDAIARRNKIPDHFANKVIIDLKRFDIEAFYQEMREQGSSNYTIKSLHQLLRAAVNFAMADETQFSNPFSRVTVTTTQADWKIPTYEQVSELGEVLKKTDQKLYTAFLISTSAALRRGELQALQWKDWDPERKLLLIDKALTDAGPGMNLGGRVVSGLVIAPTKAGTKNYMLMSDTAATQLEAWRQSRREVLGMEEGEELDGEWFIFSASHDMTKPHHLGYINREMAKIQTSHGLPRISTQMLRKFVGSVVIREFGPSVTAKMLRHSSPLTSIRSYVGVMEGDDRAATDLMERVAQKPAE